MCVCVCNLRTFTQLYAHGFGIIQIILFCFNIEISTGGIGIYRCYVVGRKGKDEKDDFVFFLF